MTISQKVPNSQHCGKKYGLCCTLLPNHHIVALLSWLLKNILYL